MSPPVNFILVAIGFLSVSAGVFLYKRKPLMIAFFALGGVLFVTPFVLHANYTRDAYEWTVVVERKLAGDAEPIPMYIDRIEWITDYEVLKRQRGHVGSAMFRGDTTRKEWKGKGYIPVQIRAEVLYDTAEIASTRNFQGHEPGSYVFTLTIDENNLLSWRIEPYPEGATAGDGAIEGDGAIAGNRVSGGAR